MYDQEFAEYRKELQSMRIIFDQMNRECVSGRDLHALLGIETDYNEWFTAICIHLPVNNDCSGYSVTNASIAETRVE